MTEIVERIHLGAGVVDVVRPAQPEALISEEAFADDEFLPYWAALWPSGLALARHLVERRLEGVEALELGCGLGLPSLAAALAGASVVATDWAPDALALLRRNAAANGVELATRLLRWDDPAPLRGRRFPLVLAADVLYEARNGPLLASLLPRVLAPGGMALVADPGRRHAPPFLDAIRDAGWSVEQLASPLVPRGGIHALTRGRVGPEA